MKLVPTPALRDIVLVGGGHAHVQVVKRFAMRPEPGLRLTLLAREPESPYSGMLPGLVEGRYRPSEIHIDLPRLCAHADARFIDGEMTHIDLAEQRIHVRGRPALRYDVLSLNTGGTPSALAANLITPVKPIGRFLPSWRALMIEAATPPEHVTVVGGGAGGVELSLAMATRFPNLAITLVAASETIVPEFAEAARRALMEALESRRIEVRLGFEVVDVEQIAPRADVRAPRADVQAPRADVQAPRADVQKPRGEVASELQGRVFSKDGDAINTDHVFWVTGVAAPSWAAASGLETDARGFITVNEHLQSVSHPNVFAAGDVASLQDQERPKSGVYAVRQGRALAANLRRRALGWNLKRFRAQPAALAIVGTGGGHAVATRGQRAVSGAWVWYLKEWIDRRFIRKFVLLPDMQEKPPRLARSLRKEAPEPMRCGGCGAKLGSSVLMRVLSRLELEPENVAVRGIGDDAALVHFDHDTLAASCDGFRAMISDPYRFGRICAHHALSDLFAMGAVPSFALAMATVPVMADDMMEEDLYQMMSGALAVFRDAGVALVGGHSAESLEPTLAFSVQGYLDGEPMTKDGLRAGEKLILTQAIGTGTILAAAMRGRARAADVAAAIDAMDRSSADAARIFRDYRVTGCTDITGFGLVGHLSEMTRASNTGARLYANSVPLLGGALDLVKEHLVSSLQESNELALADYEVKGAAVNNTVGARGTAFIGAGALATSDTRALVRLLADPQTAGGLLAGVPPESAEACVQALRDTGYLDANIIGEVTHGVMEIVVQG